MDPCGTVKLKVALPSEGFWSNFACFGFKTDFLMKFLNDSAWFCLEKLKKHVFQPKALIFDQKVLKYKKNQKDKPKIYENTSFLGFPVDLWDCET